MTRVLGIDPGQRGGAALLDHGALTWWACWRPCARGMRVWTSPAAPVDVPSLAHVGVILATQRPDVAALEAVHIRTRKGISSASVVSLAEGAGLLSAPLLLAGVELRRVTVDQWAALGGGTGPTQTERAVRHVRRVYPGGLPEASVVGSVDSIGAMAEAALMAALLAR